MKLFDLAEESARGERWRELLRAPSLSVGLYQLRAGAEDTQQPHTEDEVYVVLAGRAAFECAGETHAIGPGSVIYVDRADVHRFHTITEDLRLFVLFAPPEGSLRT